MVAGSNPVTPTVNKVTAWLSGSYLICFLSTGTISGQPDNDIKPIINRLARVIFLILVKKMSTLEPPIPKDTTVSVEYYKKQVYQVY